MRINVKYNIQYFFSFLIFQYKRKKKQMQLKSLTLKKTIQTIYNLTLNRWECKTLKIKQ